MGKHKIYIRAGFRRMQVYLAVHANVVMRSARMKDVCREYAKFLNIEIPIGSKKKPWHVALILEQYNNPESKIYKGNPPIKSPFKRIAKKKKQDKKKEYAAYMRSAKWISFRNAIKEKRGNKCEICDYKGKGLHGHHLTYERFMNELEEDIQIVCLQCHEKIHGRKFEKRK